MKILIDELPKTAKECPFALHCFSDNKAYPICKLKHKGLYDNISFSFVSNKYTCLLCEGKECDCLKVIRQTETLDN